MDQDRDNGGDAFPTTEHQHTETGHYPVTRNGMSLRDYFAAKAPPQEINTIMVLCGWTNLTGEAWLDKATQARYMHADAMLKARQ